jgi:hypothetical protein
MTIEIPITIASHAISGKVTDTPAFTESLQEGGLPTGLLRF